MAIPLEPPPPPSHHSCMTDPQRPFQRLDCEADIDRPRLSRQDGKRIAVFPVANVAPRDIDLGSRLGTLFRLGRQSMDCNRKATA